MADSVGILSYVAGLIPVVHYALKLCSSLAKFFPFGRDIFEFEQSLSPLPQLPQSYSPWAFEKEPNPVLFKHLYYAAPTIIDTKWRHIPIDLNHIKRKREFVLDDSRQQKRPVIDWATTGRDGKHDTGTEDGSKIKGSHGILGMGDGESDGDAGAVVEEPNLGSTPPDKDVFACPHCETSFSKLGKLNQHLNLKHIRRFRCSSDNCTAAFFLKADLARHERTVHRSHRTEDTCFRCPNESCNMREKVFLRKDNFDRHVRRCE